MPVQRPDGIESRVRSAANRCLRERRYKLAGSWKLGAGNAPLGKLGRVFMQKPYFGRLVP
jgi:hypothetical protein